MGVAPAWGLVVGRSYISSYLKLACYELSQKFPSFEDAIKWRDLVNMAMNLYVL